MSAISVTADNDILHFRDEADDTLSVHRFSDGGLNIEMEDSNDGRVIEIWLEPEDTQRLVKHIAPTKVVDPVTIWEGSEGHEREAWNRIALEAAAGLGLRAEFSYAKGDGSVIERRLVNVTKLDRDHAHPLVVGYDDYRNNEYRAFRLDRIKGFVTVVGKHA